MADNIKIAPVVTFDPSKRYQAIVSTDAAADGEARRLELREGATLPAGGANGLLKLDGTGKVPGAYGLVTADQLAAALSGLGSGAGGGPVLVAWADAAKDLAVTDNGTFQRASALQPILTVRLQSAVAYADRFYCYGTAPNGLTIVPEAGVLINGSGGPVQVAPESAFGWFILFRLSTNNFNLFRNVVQSVNGAVGNIILDAEDVGAAAAAHTHEQGDIVGLDEVIQAMQQAMSPTISTSTLVPGPGTPSNVWTIVPGDALYLGTVRVAAPPSDGTPVIASFSAGSATLAGNNGTPVNVDDIVTVSYPAVVGFPPPSLEFVWKFGGVAISGAPNASQFKVPAGSGGKVLTCTITARNDLGSASLTTATGITINSPGVTFPSWTGTWWPFTQLAVAPSGRLQFTISASATFDSAFDYYLATPDFATATDALVAAVIARGDLVSAGAVMTRPQKSAGTIVYPMIIAVHKATYPAAGSWQTIATKSAYTITGGGVDYPITHIATAANLASNAAFTAWLTGLPSGAVGGTPSGSYACTANLTAANFTKTVPVRVRPIDRENPTVFTRAGIECYGGDGLILDGLIFDGSTVKDSAGYPTVNSLVFTPGYNITVENCVIKGHRRNAQFWGSGFIIRRNDFSQFAVDNVECYQDFQTALIEHNWFHDPFLDPKQKTHPDHFQGAANDDTHFWKDVTFQYNRFEVSSATLYNQILFINNEKLVGQNGLKPGNVWHKNITVKGNYFLSSHRHTIAGVGIDGWIVTGNLIHMKPGESREGTGVFWPCISPIYTDLDYYKPASYSFTNNVFPFSVLPPGWEQLLGTAAVISGNQEGNYSKVTHTNGSAVPSGWSMPDVGPYSDVTVPVSTYTPPVLLESWKLDSGASVTIPVAARVDGALILLYGFNPASSTPITSLPTGFTMIDHQEANSATSCVAYAFWHTGDSNSIAMPSGAKWRFAAYSGVDPSDPIGAVAKLAGSSAVLTYPALTAEKSPSVFSRFGGVRSVATLTVPPDFVALQGGGAANGNSILWGMDTATRTLALAADAAPAMAATSSGHHTWSVELRGITT